jgi:arylsulfatase A-like enzyme/Tfp pilus assembly protein PilF
VTVNPRWGAVGLGISLALGASGLGCRPPREGEDGPSGPRTSILLVTLDTTRADSIGPEAAGVATPVFDALAARGRRFLHAYATAPETLPSHSSMFTGLYPAGHGVRQNALPLPRDRPLAAERLREVGYGTSAFVSSFALDRRFGLARGFDVYDDEPAPGRSERVAADTTDRALAWLRRSAGDARPVFVWVHYYDPHHPYEPPGPYRDRYRDRPYLGEIAAMDEQLGRLVQVFEEKAPAPRAILVVGDHGEGLGDHGEQQHGNLLYQSTMHVPLLLVAPGVSRGTSPGPVSVRQVLPTLLDLAGLPDGPHSLRKETAGIVLGEAMKPFLAYGWQPQVMAVEGRQKAILAGRFEVYDLQGDPGETRDLAAEVTPSRTVRDALREYPVPDPAGNRPAGVLDDEARQRLASLGYVAAGAAPLVRKDAPRPVDQVALFPVLDEASVLFVGGRYREVIPLLRNILSVDPGNLDAWLRLATAHSGLGDDRQALQAFDRALEIAPDSQDARVYRALHLARGPRFEEAGPVLEAVLAASPDRLPALEALARVRERQGNPAEELDLRLRVLALRKGTPADQLRVGRLAMDLGRTSVALPAFEAARDLQGEAFRNHLELGVLYLAVRRLDEARTHLDRVSPRDPGYPMALFKRAQVAVLLDEPDRAARIRRAREAADPATRALIERERLFSARP